MEEKVLPTVSREELTAIIRRLEAATSRLEDMASSTIEPPTSNGNAQTKEIGGPPVPAPTGPLPPPPIPKPTVEEVPASVEEFDAFLSGALKKYVTLSEGLGGPVAEQASAFDHLREQSLTEQTGCKGPESVRSATKVSPDQHESEETSDG
jgi:adenylyl cyclase-associated protein